MHKLFRLLAVVMGLQVVLGHTDAASAQDGDLQAAVALFRDAGYSQTVDAVDAVAATQDDRAVRILRALEEGNLHTVQETGQVVIATETADGQFEAVDAVSEETVGTFDPWSLDKVKVNNRVRRAINTAMGSLTLFSKRASMRIEAANTLFDRRDPEMTELLARAVAEEQDSSVKRAMLQAQAAIALESDVPEAEKIEAVKLVEERGNRSALILLSQVAEQSEGDLKAAAQKGVESLEARLEILGWVQNAWYGLSLGSVLLLAAIGLAITFGVMGVINMAHGELVMLGAYTTFVVQEVFRASFPEAFDYSVIVALPLAFLVAGAVGIAIERGVIRFLYGRPLETLLATWGISLILQQLVRNIFGPSNVEVGAPSWMSGTVELTAGLPLTLNRLWIVAFSLVVFAVLTLVIKRSTFGLRMRAVTQNRRMANSVGIRSSWVDAMTFGLGSGVAGIAGVALSQISNVSPNLGQSYIIDSFLVVVFGGVGNLWGTLVGALSLGVANKFLEPMAGAVLAKILILVAVILFIQRRPRGLFAQRGRAVEN
jgi:urea transport system permease protein